MKTHKIKTKDLDVEWKIIIPASEINLELDMKYVELQKEVKIPISNFPKDVQEKLQQRLNHT